MSGNEIAKAFVNEVKEMAKARGLNVFVLTDGVSGVSNNGNPAIKNAKEAQIKWEKENGFCQN